MNKSLFLILIILLPSISIAESRPGKVLIQEVIIFTDDNTPIKAIKRLDDDNHPLYCNSHGMTFADCQLSILNSEIGKVLKGDHYKEVEESDVRVGDIAVYWNENKNAVLSGTVVKTSPIRVSVKINLDEKPEIMDADKANPEKNSTLKYYRK